MGLLREVQQFAVTRLGNVRLADASVESALRTTSGNEAFAPLPQRWFSQPSCRRS